MVSVWSVNDRSASRRRHVNICLRRSTDHGLGDQGSWIYNSSTNYFSPITTIPTKTVIFVWNDLRPIGDALLLRFDADHFRSCRRLGRSQTVKTYGNQASELNLLVIPFWIVASGRRGSATLIMRARRKKNRRHLLHIRFRSFSHSLSTIQQWPAGSHLRNALNEIPKTSRKHSARSSRAK